MMRQTFTSWLYQQRHRDDPVGDLASDAWADRHRGQGNTPRSYRGWKRHLSSCGACDGAYRALLRAWTEWHGSPQMELVK